MKEAADKQLDKVKEQNYELSTNNRNLGNAAMNAMSSQQFSNTKNIAAADDLVNGGKDNTTNNRMELTAAIEALKYFEDKQTITLITDSKYVKDGIQSWIQNWKKNGWKTAAKKPVKNKELWIELDQLISRHTISWEWVKGHDGNKHNEKADYLARRYIEEA